MSADTHRVEDLTEATAAATAVLDALSADQSDAFETTVDRLLGWTEAITLEPQTTPDRVRITAVGPAATPATLDSETVAQLTPGAVSRRGVVGNGPPTVSCVYAAAHEPLPALPQRVGLATEPAAGEDKNGDGALFVHTDERLLCGVIDGLGHGPKAAAASKAALTALEDHPNESLPTMFSGIDTACRETRGVVAALAAIDYGTETGQFGSVGNIDWRVDGLPFSLVPRRGVIGTGAPQPTVTSGAWPGASRLVLYSDGVRGVGADVIQGELTSAPTILEQHGHSEDDATVLTVYPHE